MPAAGHACSAATPRAGRSVDAASKTRLLFRLCVGSASWRKRKLAARVPGKRRACVSPARQPPVKRIGNATACASRQRMPAVGRWHRRVHTCAAGACRWPQRRQWPGRIALAGQDEIFCTSFETVWQQAHRCSGASSECGRAVVGVRGARSGGVVVGGRWLVAPPAAVAPERNPVRPSRAGAGAHRRVQLGQLAGADPRRPGEPDVASRHRGSSAGDARSLGRAAAPRSVQGGVGRRRRAKPAERGASYVVTCAALDRQRCGPYAAASRHGVRVSDHRGAIGGQAHQAGEATGCDAAVAVRGAAG
ncbi:hypothetical protein XTGART2_0472 [Xanthomonas translucens pv. graminis]|uniref:Uncharacterized protein n=1 Tax=Xanthomonas graminis pv. graminis TaxID=134874 RepID=A0A1M4IAQ4_9XANT|nr:hypothetical protein XTG29_01880 [Xanthomonas translucens pv. graminis ART-Xtg29]SBV39351.1 hypothetical protein XTGART2_0472 [Xanthomonas translucens pv. graminis]SBV45882.1 hypothetical protein XTGART29_0500 [Xanthomonas translucens pv. graminis ART-Xtg29]SBV57335.1 hypothetical protein XTGICMP6431_0485 [Xanthomonas translucens pv. graminis]SBV86567.1 hypothetical protein XTGNCPPB3709_0468 [Xanthomonas translucens pv. graminis]